MARIILLNKRTCHCHSCPASKRRGYSQYYSKQFIKRCGPEVNMQHTNMFNTVIRFSIARCIESLAAMYVMLTGIIVQF